MKVGEFDPDDFSKRLRGEGVAIRCGPFTTHIVSELADLAGPVQALYADFPVAGGDFADFHTRLRHAPGLIRRLRGQIVFTMDREIAFRPLPRQQALPVLEWGLNWCIYKYAHQYLIIHAAVIQKGDVTCIMPAISGAGKSTLCAALVSRGWRLLSDELSILRLGDASAMPLTRPISLKNESIELMQDFAPDQSFGPCFGNTRKGTIAHMKPPGESVRRMDEPSRPTHIVFPAWRRGSDASLESVAKGPAFFRVADCSLNYHILGQEGFSVLAELIDRCDCLEFAYSALDDAVHAFDGLV